MGKASAIPIQKPPLHANGSRHGRRRRVNVLFDEQGFADVTQFARRKDISVSAAIRLLAEFGLAAVEESRRP